MVCYARSRHVSALDPAAGFLAQAAHVLAVFAWMGLLLIFAWFSREEVQWKNVLSWFSPLAVLCMVGIVVSGLSVMGFVAPEYVYSWVLPYGQALLIKHLLLLPLMALAFLNGFLHPYRLRKNADLKPWFKAESVLAVAVLAVTAYMGRQVPPHDVSSVLLNEPPSSLFLMLYPGEFSPGQPLRLSPTPEGSALALMALAMFALSGYFYVRLRRIPVFFTAFSIALGLVLAYGAAMLMIRQT
jgi:putative copper resistance protein D